MKIGRPFNTLTPTEYCFFIDNYRKYTDFNTLGLYRSIIENKTLDTAQQIELRDYAHKTFGRSFEFLQLKDPWTYFELSTLGQSLTCADERQIWDSIIANQEKLLADKRIKHRNFGGYSKHSCYESCPLNGLMIRQGSAIAEGQMRFHSDKGKYSAKWKSSLRKAERKNEGKIIQADIDDD